MRENVRSKNIRAMGAWGIALGVLTAILGALAIGAPAVAGLATTLMVAGLLVVAGIARVIWAFRAPTFAGGVATLLFGGITLAAGLLIFASPGIGLGTLALLLAFYFVVDGVFEILLAADLRPTRGWGWMMFAGVVGLALGVLILAQFPLSGLWAVGTLVGVHLVIAGLSMIFLGVSARRLTATERPATPAASA